MNLNFTFKSFLLIFLSGLYSITITVGSDPTDDYTTIQEGIDAASDGDIVLVGDGTYTENIVIESEITLTSVGGHQTTIIDGSGAIGNMGSTITIRPESGSPTIPQNIGIDGFTITGGIGNEMKKSGTQLLERKGGGIMAYNVSPKITGNNIHDNGNSQTSNGGGIVAIDSAEDWSFNDREWELNPELTPTTDPLDLSDNIFLNNYSTHARSVYIEGFLGLTTNLSSGYFDCASTNYQDVTDFWVRGENLEFNFEGLESQYEAITSYAVYVDPVNGIDQFNESWIGDETHPFKTINYALGMIYTTEENPVTIYLSEGIYSPSTNGDIYPIELPAYISLIGQGETPEGVVLHNNGELGGGATGSIQQYGMIKMDGYSQFDESHYQITISNITFSEQSNYSGKSIYIVASDSSNDSFLILDRLIFSDNNGTCIFIKAANALLSNITVTNNQRVGLTVEKYSDVYVYNSIFWDNVLAQQQQELNPVLPGEWSYYDGAGIYFRNPSNSSLYINNSIIDPYEGIIGGCSWLCDFIGSGYGCSDFQNESECFDANITCNGYYDDEGEYVVPPVCEWDSNLGCVYVEYDDGPDIPDCYGLDIDSCNNSWNCYFTSLTPNSPSYGEVVLNNNPLFSNSYNLGESSPAIDMGTAYMPYSNGYIQIPENLYVDGNGDGISVPDMGAIEYIPNQQNGDLNGDGSVNVIDIVALVNIILNDLDTQGADYNGDGTVNVIDVVALVHFVLT
jgi:hypothetical protein